MSDEIGQRAYLIAQLEAHYARVLRQNVVNLVDLARKRNPETEVTLGHFLTWTEGIYRDAQEGAEIVMAAHQCPDEALNDFVRWQTNPAWKRSMERAGMFFDTRELIWKEAT